MADNHVVLNVHIEAVAGHEDELAGKLLALVGPTRAEAGCLTYELHRDPKSPGKFMFYEKFKSQADLDAHIAAPHFQAFVAYRAAAKPDPVASTVVSTWQSIA